MCLSSSNILLQGVLQPINLFISTTAYKTNPRKRIFELVFRTTQNSVSGILQAENREADINTIFVYKKRGVIIRAWSSILPNL